MQKLNYFISKCINTTYTYTFPKSENTSSLILEYYRRLKHRISIRNVIRKIFLINKKRQKSLIIHVLFVCTKNHCTKFHIYRVSNKNYKPIVYNGDCRLINYFGGSSIKNKIRRTFSSISIK